eukprot:SAG31_NODE_650_length_13187_cov_3.011843_7_plen_46_part_00
MVHGDQLGVGPPDPAGALAVADQLVTRHPVGDTSAPEARRAGLPL